MRRLLKDRSAITPASLVTREVPLRICFIKMEKSRKMFPLAFIIFNIFYWGGIMTNLALRESYEAMDTGADHHDDFLDDDFFENPVETVTQP